MARVHFVLFCFGAKHTHREPSIDLQAQQQPLKQLMRVFRTEEDVAELLRLIAGRRNGLRKLFGRTHIPIIKSTAQ